MSPADTDQDPFEALRHRIRDVELPAGKVRSGWRADVDTLLGLHARWLFDRVRRAAGSHPDAEDGLTMSQLHDLLEDELARHP